LDHFKVYNTSPVSLDALSVQLQGQFDGAPRLASVVELSHFALPVRKNGERIIDQRNHLTWFRLAPTGLDPLRQVEIDNQFGRQTLRTGQLQFLAVPARNISRQLLEPEDLDHFECYQVISSNPVSIDKTVQLADDSGVISSTVERPFLFCVPTVKVHDGQRYEIKHPEGHLTFYGLSKISANSIGDTAMSDQFANSLKRTWIVSGSSGLLGVPTIKIGVEVVQ